MLLQVDPHGPIRVSADDCRRPITGMGDRERMAFSAARDLNRGTALSKRRRAKAREVRFVHPLRASRRQLGRKPTREPLCAPLGRRQALVLPPFAGGKKRRRPPEPFGQPRPLGRPAAPREFSRQSFRAPSPLQERELPLHRYATISFSHVAWRPCRSPGIHRSRSRGTGAKVS